MEQRKIPDVWQTSLDQGLWSKVDPDWLTVDASDRRARKIESIDTAGDSQSPLSQIDTDWTQSEMNQLVKHPTHGCGLKPH